MTEAMPFLQKAILLSYDSRPIPCGNFYEHTGRLEQPVQIGNMVMVANTLTTPRTTAGTMPALKMVFRL